jgi:threonyl-tRNA synthetase
MPFILPKGMIVWNELTQFIRNMLFKAGYTEIKTPSVMTRNLWEKSGHWFNYKENMFSLEIEDRDFAVKPMNCPGCILYYQSESHSYRELPLRIGEIGNVHRYEPSGSLSGLFRVRSFHQDDAHIFLMPDQIKDEILKILGLADKLYSTFGLSYHLELSTRPKENTIGTDEEWELATNALKEALDSSKRPYKINEGDGAFYGPKIDFHIKDALGRTWQCGTVQLDWALPDKFELEYASGDGTRKRPVLIHRALMGSIERFFGILIEHFAGKFPLWLSPQQVILLTVADRHIDRAKEIEAALKEEGFHVSVDATSESISKKVRSAQLNKINYILTIGDKEVENGLLSVRTRDGAVHGDVDLPSFMQRLEAERKSKQLQSLWT